MPLIHERHLRDSGYNDLLHSKEDAMNKIVRTHYPVEKLPEDLRWNLPEGSTVTVTLQKETGDQIELTRSEFIEKLKVLRDRMPVTEDDPVKRIRQLRDEWDD